MADGCSVCGSAGSDGKLRRGMCRKHYQRWRAHGDPTIVLRPMPEVRGAPRHGTSSRYNAGCRCEACGAANSVYLKRWRASNRDRARSHKAHWGNDNPKAARLSAWSTEQRRRGLPPSVETVDYAGVLLGDPCSYCGGTAGQIDHIAAQTMGGGGDWGNLTAACGSCNSQKHTKGLLHFMLDRVG